MSKREFVKTYYQKFLDLNNSTQHSDQGNFKHLKLLRFICAIRHFKQNFTFIRSTLKFGQSSVVPESKLSKYSEGTEIVTEEKSSKRTKFKQVIEIAFLKNVYIKPPFLLITLQLKCLQKTHFHLDPKYRCKWKGRQIRMKVQSRMLRHRLLGKNSFNFIVS